MFSHLQDINSTGYLWMFFFGGVLDVLLSSGITFGWAGIVYIFKMELFFIDLCPLSIQQSALTSLLDNTSNKTILQERSRFKHGFPGCIEQDSRLQLIFTVAMFVQSVTLFFSGILVDRYGPKMIRGIGFAIYMFGCFGLAFMNRDNANLLFLVFTLIMIGSQFLVMAVYQSTNIIFRRFRGAATSIMFGAFDSSAVVLLLFKIIYQSGFSLKLITFCYCIIVFIISNLMTIVLIPPQHVLRKWTQEEMESLSEKSRISETSLEHSKNEKTPLVPAEKMKKKDSLRSHICSPFYILHVFYLSVFQLKLWYYVGTLPDDLTQLSNYDNEKVSDYIDIFGYCQFGGLLVSPVLAFILDKDKLLGKSSKTQGPVSQFERTRNCVPVFAVTTILCIIFCIANSLPVLKIQVLSFLVYMIVRAFLYGSHGVFIGAAFPAKDYGTLFGIGMLVAAATGALQYPLFEIRSRLMGNQPLGVQLIIFGLVICACVHPIHVYWRTRDTEKNRQRFETS
ncbi:equilibrative nucleobase transporter 1-like [Clytia hemisphaerica]|uniref:Solute carrier family 43 member 3 n=1 Tax=Clytia hemisphaerica TaxID=252671 RepID=A0A7M5X0U4_9CNID|eukprot:TCONS_00008313-protein